MKRRNIYIASTLVLALVLMVGFPTSGKTPSLERFYQGCGEKVELACQDLGNRLDGGTKDGRVCEKAHGAAETPRRQTCSNSPKRPRQAHGRANEKAARKTQHCASPPQGEARGSEQTSPATAEDPTSEARQGRKARQGRAGS